MAKVDLSEFSAHAKSQRDNLNNRAAAPVVENKPASKATELWAKFRAGERERYTSQVIGSTFLDFVRAASYLWKQFNQQEKEYFANNGWDGNWNDVVVPAK